MISRLCRFGWMALIALMTATGFAHGQEIKAKPNLITADVDDQQRVILHGSVSQALKSAVDLGSIAARTAQFEPE